MLTWSAVKSTLVTAEETGEGSKMARAVKTSVLRHHSTDTSNASSLLKKESAGFSSSLYKIPKRLLKLSNSKYIKSSDETLNIYFYDHKFYG